MTIRQPSVMAIRIFGYGALNNAGPKKGLHKMGKPFTGKLALYSSPSLITPSASALALLPFVHVCTLSLAGKLLTSALIG